MKRPVQSDVQTIEPSSARAVAVGPDRAVRA